MKAKICFLVLFITSFIVRDFVNVVFLNAIKPLANLEPEDVDKTCTQ